VYQRRRPRPGKGREHVLRLTARALLQQLVRLHPDDEDDCGDAR
jgi:hypothetical protein